MPWRELYVNCNFELPFVQKNLWSITLSYYGFHMPVISWSNVCEGPYQRPFESPYICSQFVRLSPNLMCGCDSYFGISCMATHVIGVYRRGDLPPTEERYGMSVIQWTLWYHQRVPKKITMRSFPPTPSCRLPLIAFPWSAEGLAAAYTAVRCVCVNPLMDSDLTCWAVIYWYITYVHRWACDKAHVKFFLCYCDSFSCLLGMLWLF